MFEPVDEPSPAGATDEVSRMRLFPKSADLGGVPHEETPYLSRYGVGGWLVANL